MQEDCEGIPGGLRLGGGWDDVLAGPLSDPALMAEWRSLQAFVAAERARGEVYPPASEVFAAFEATPYGRVRAVLLGQDPYHGPGQAHGLCFSVRDGVPPPPSLRNILSELAADLGVPPPASPCLEPWARHGVLLLNATLTVRAGEPGSHQGHGWERFTDAVLRVVAARPEPVVFLLWGNWARRKRAVIERVADGRHAVAEAAHPSPLSARRGFLGTRPFTRANEALVAVGGAPIDWRLDRPVSEGPAA